jgi:hypothetical protein
MMNAYLEYTWRYLPIVDETALWTSFNQVYAHDTASPFDHFLLRIMMATSLIASPNSNAAQARYDAVTNLREALSYINYILRPGSVGSMQTLLLLAVYSVMDPTYFDWWTLLGSASRAMVDIGMHHDPPKSANMPRSELDLRRRVFWCTYSLDRMAALILHRDFSIEEGSVNVAFPSAASTPAAALAMFQLRVLQTEVLAALNEISGVPPNTDREQHVWDLYNSLAEWAKSSGSSSSDLATARALSVEYEFTCCYLFYPSSLLKMPEEQTQPLRSKHASTYFELIGTATALPLFVRAIGNQNLWQVIAGT